MTQPFRFPLLDLKRKPYVKILAAMDLHSLFNFSKCSSLTERSLQKMRMKRKDCFAICNRFSYPRGVELSSGAEKHAVWNFHGVWDAIVSDLRFAKSHTIRILDTQMKFYWFKNSYHCISERPELFELIFIAHLSELFCTTVIDLKIDLEEVEVAEIPKTLRSCRLRLYGHEATVSHEEMRTLLDDFETPHLNLSCTSGPGFKFAKKLDYKVLILKHSEWVTINHIMGIDYQVLHLERCTLRSENFNQFIKAWLDGTSTQLEYFYAGSQQTRWPFDNTPEHNFELDKEKVLMGIETIPTTPKNRWGSKFREIVYDVQYEDGVDVKRPYDGMLATILCTKTERSNGDFFGLVVWSTLHPDLAQFA